MKLNMIDWLRETAKFMAADSPDVYDSPEEAVSDLDQAMLLLRETGVNCFSFGPYVIIRGEEEGIEEFLLSRKVSIVALFIPEEETRVYGYTDEVDLPSPLDESQDDDVE